MSPFIPLSFFLLSFFSSTSFILLLLCFLSISFRALWVDQYSRDSLPLFNNFCCAGVNRAMVCFFLASNMALRLSFFSCSVSPCGRLRLGVFGRFCPNLEDCLNRAASCSRRCRSLFCLAVSFLGGGPLLPHLPGGGGRPWGASAPSSVLLLLFPSFCPAKYCCCLAFAKAALSIMP